MCECCCKEEAELTKEELVESAIENISEGGCLGCTLSQMFDIGYSQGKQDLAKESIEFYADVLVEDSMEE